MIMQSYQNGLNVLGRVGVELYRNKPDITYKFVFYSISFAVDRVKSSAQSRRKWISSNVFSKWINYFFSFSLWK